MATLPRNEFPSLIARQAGMIIPIAAGAMLMIAGVTAFAVDIGYQRVVDNELHNVVDAAALAGASGFKSANAPLWSEGCNRARAALSLNKAANQTLNTSQSSTDYTLESGHATFSSGKFVFVPHGSGTNACIGGAPAFTPGQYPAVRVSARRTSSSTSGGITSYFAKVFGIESLGVTAVSSAMIGVPSTAPGSALFPMAIGLCSFQSYWAADGTPLTTNSITFGSVQNNGNSGDNGKGNGNGSSTCVDKMQWTTLDPTESNISDSDTINEGTCGGSPNSASKVACLIGGELEPPAIQIGQTVNINIQNGSRAGLYGQVETHIVNNQSSPKIFLVPVVSSETITLGDNSVTPVVRFVALEILGAQNGQKTITVKPVPNFKVPDARPGTGGTPIAGTTTRAFLIL